MASRDQLQTALGADDDPERVVRDLIDLAYRAGAPENIACVVAHVVEL